MKGLAITPGEPEEPAGRRQERGQGQRPEPALRRFPVARPAAVRQHELVQRPQLLRRPEGPRRRDARGRRRTSSRPSTPPTTPRWSSSATSIRRRRKAWIEKYFAAIPASKLPPPSADISEPRQEKEKRVTKPDALATRPALAIGYHAPTREHARVLRDGPARPDPGAGQGQPPLSGARAEERPDRRRRAAGSTRASATCSTSTARRSGTSRSSTTRTRPPTQILKVFDVEIETDPHDAGRPGDARPRARQDALAASTTRWSSSFGFGRADLLASFALFDDDPGTDQPASRTSSAR